MSPPELGGGGGQMQDFGLSFEMCIHGKGIGGSAPNCECVVQFCRIGIKRNDASN